MPKTIDEAIELSLRNGPLKEVPESLKISLMKFIGKRVMELGDNASASDLFDDLFLDRAKCRSCQEVIVKDLDSLCGSCQGDEAEYLCGDR